MSGIFNLESPVVRAVTRVGDLAVLSLMWFVGCIPLVTIGASSTAMYSAIHKVFSQKEGIAAAEFLRSFKSNFRQATLSFLPLGALELLLLAECFVTEFLSEQGTAWLNLRPVFLVLSYLAALWMVMAAAYAARFQDSAKTTLRHFAPGKSLAKHAASGRPLADRLSPAGVPASHRHPPRSVWLVRSQNRGKNLHALSRLKNRASRKTAATHENAMGGCVFKAHFK